MREMRNADKIFIEKPCGRGDLIRDINIKMSQSNRASGVVFEIFVLLRCYSA
jgi:hypothetical protein